MKKILGHLFLGSDVISLAISFVICLVLVPFLTVLVASFVRWDGCVISIFPKPHLTEKQVEEISQATFEQLLFIILFIIIWFVCSGKLALILSFIAFLWASHIVEKERKEREKKE